MPIFDLNVINMDINIYLEFERISTTNINTYLCLNVININVNTYLDLNVLNK